MTKTLALLALALAPALAGAEEAHLQGFAPAATALLGGYGAGYPYGDVDGRTGQPFGQVQLELRDGWGRFAFDASALALVPFADSGSRAAGAFGLRAGVGFPHVRALAGFVLDKSLDAPLQPLPSLTVEAGSGDWRGLLGVFDQTGLVPMRVGVAWRQFSVAYVPALGVELAGGVPVTRAVAIEGRAFVYELLAAEAVDLALGVSVALPGGER